jgi:hypothetical protein
MFLIKKLGELNNEIDVPDEYSKLFKVENWMTEHQTVQIGNSILTAREAKEIINKYLPLNNKK